MTSAISAATRLEALGITYWSDGPVGGTLWALDRNGTTILVSSRGEIITGGTPAQRAAVKRAGELTAAQRHPQCRVATRDNIPYGLEVPCERRVANPARGRVDDLGPGPDGVHRYRRQEDTHLVPGFRLVPFERFASVHEYPTSRVADRVGPIRQLPDARTYPRIADLPITVEHR